MNIILLFFAIKYKGDWNRIYYALESKEKVRLYDIKKLESEVEARNLEFFTILDECYPQWFKNTYKPPFVLFYKGNLKLLENGRFVALTGDFEIGEQHKPVIESFANEVLDKFSLVTGLFKGTDKLVAEKAIAKNTSTILLSANGVEDPYASVEIGKFDYDNTLLLSEYPQTHVTKDRLRARNRLIAAISEAIVVLNSRAGSSIINLVTNGLNLGKEILCVPDLQNPNSTNNELIRQGATLVSEAQDVLQLLATTH